MAKQAGDTYTLDLLDKPKRGRPRKPDAKNVAQRAREYRARKRAVVVKWNMFTWIPDLVERKPELLASWNRPFVCSHGRNWEESVCPICCMFQDHLLPHHVAMTR